MSLRRIFKSQQEETLLQKARRTMMGSLAEAPDEGVETYLTEFQFLIDEWLDEFERQIYEGATLKQLLQQA